MWVGLSGQVKSLVIGFGFEGQETNLLRGISILGALSRLTKNCEVIDVQS